MAEQERTAELIRAAIHDREVVQGLTHGFYRYPARFSPKFVRTVIGELTNPGDVILDCFMGGATSAVEAMALGRNFVGSDLNSLAVFLAKVKTTILCEAERANLRAWQATLLDEVNLRTGSMPDDDRAARIPWNLRKTIGLSIASAEKLPSLKIRMYARCSLLRTAQWALDCSRRIHAKSDFLNKHAHHLEEMLAGTEELANEAANMQRHGLRTVRNFFHCRAADLADKDLAGIAKATILITSPPYPGVHVLYHRWQIQGRRETAAPYWVADCVDGNAPSYYTLAPRRPADWSGYMRGVTESFGAARRLLKPGAKVIQLIAFSDPDVQYPLYQTAMLQAGYVPDQFPGSEFRSNQTIRQVPNRKWYAEIQGYIPSSKEYVLVHRNAED